MVKAYIEAFSNGGNSGELNNYISSDFKLHTLHLNAQPVGETQPKNMEEASKQGTDAFSPSHKTIDDIFSDGDRVVVRWTVVATHSGMFMDLPATNKEVKYSGIDIYRIAEGKIAELWYVWDRLGLYQELGIAK